MTTLIQDNRDKEIIENGLTDEQMTTTRPKVNHDSVRDIVQATTYGTAPSKLEKLSERRDESVFDLGMVSRLCVGKYRTSIFGETLMKDCTSLHQYTMLLERLRPGTIFDLGTAGGGSALWFASQIRALKLPASTQIISFDIEDMRTESCKKLFAEEPNIKFVLGDLYDGANVLRNVQQNENIDMPHPWIISEDCHVDASVILKAFTGFGMQKGDYIVFEDTHTCVADDSGVNAENIDEYRYGSFSREKMSRIVKAIQDYGGDEKFAVDATVQDIYGYNGAFNMNSVFVKIADD